jgi:hypothetical protein
MFDKLDQQVRDTYQHAYRCAERAQAAKDLRERTEWMVLERRYLSLARGIEFALQVRRSRQRQTSVNEEATG